MKNVKINNTKNNTQDWKKNLQAVIVTSAVFAAVITAIVNLTIALINSHQIRDLREEQRISEIATYRYTKLYELVVNWHDSDDTPEYDGKGDYKKYVQKINVNRFLHNFGSYGRYERARPLLDSEYQGKLDAIADEGNKKINEIIVAAQEIDKATIQNASEDELIKLNQRHSELMFEFNLIFFYGDEVFKKTMQEQLGSLLAKNN